MKTKIYSLVIAIIFSNLLIAQAGNVGINTPTPASKLTVNGNMSIGAGYTAVAAPANGSIIQGNVGVGTSAPIAKLDVIGKIKITDGTQAMNKILVSDANGIGSWQDPSQSKEIIALMNTVDQNVLANIPIGGGSVLSNFVQSLNTIPGATFNPVNDRVFLPQGTYEVSVSYEISRALGTCPAAGFIINSYFIDFPNISGVLRVHSNAPSICGVNSIHSALWVTTIIIPAGGGGFEPHIGRGQGGNYTDTILLSTNSRILFKKIL